MLLGKPPRPPIRRTTSMTDISVDVVDPPAADHPPHAAAVPPEHDGSLAAFTNPSNNMMMMMGGFVGGGNNSNGFYYSYDDEGDDDKGRFLATVASPRPHHRTGSGDFVETPHFLRTCGLCGRRLSPGKDIYMYRGDTAFCSLECRERKMKQDERKEKHKQYYKIKNKEEDPSSPPPRILNSSTKTHAMAAPSLPTARR